ncbi:MAG: hypothetical protein ACK53L_14945 [Pirellulaceae bacterium]
MAPEARFSPEVQLRGSAPGSGGWSGLKLESGFVAGVGEFEASPVVRLGNRGEFTQGAEGGLGNLLEASLAVLGCQQRVARVRLGIGRAAPPEDLAMGVVVVIVLRLGGYWIT